jgi:hypothetical protein
MSEGVFHDGVVVLFGACEDAGRVQNATLLNTLLGVLYTVRGNIGS